MPEPNLAFPRAVLFDLDGTLVDSLPDLAVAANAMRTELGEPPLPTDTIARFVGNGVRKLVHRTLTGRLDGEADEARFAHGFARFRTLYLERCCEATVVREGAVETLVALRERGIACGVVTNKSEAPMRRILEHYRLAPHLGAAIGGDTPFGRKPDPATLVEAARRMGIDARTESCWLVGDSTTDLKTAVAAGIPGIFLRGGYHHGEAPERIEPPPTRTIERLWEVVELVERG